MTLAIGAGTRLFAVLGDPVAHSLSPRIQNAAIRALHLDAVYLALRADSDTFPGLMRGLAHAGGGGNVTLPHKQLAATLIDHPTAALQATGACNTFWLEDGKIRGDNTDVEGFAVAARMLLNGSLEGTRVLLLGAGGAARAVLYALAREGVDQVVILNRTAERAAALISGSQTAGIQVHPVQRVEELRGQHFDLVANATSLGLRDDDPLPLDPAAGATFTAALDLVYALNGTRWIRELRELGIHAADGKEMLVQQGAASFERWWAREAPVEQMRSALS